LLIGSPCEGVDRTCDSIQHGIGRHSEKIRRILVKRKFFTIIGKGGIVSKILLGSRKDMIRDHSYQAGLITC